MPGHGKHLVSHLPSLIGQFEQVGNSNMPLTTKDLDKFREENKKEMKELMTEVFRSEVNALVEPLKDQIKECRDEIASCKGAQAKAKSDTEIMIVTEPLKQKDREGQLYITGIKTKEEVTELVKNILQAEPDIKFCVLLNNRRTAAAPVDGTGDAASSDAACQSKNCIIGLRGEQAKVVLALKAQYLKNNQTMKHIGIHQSLTPLQARVRNKLYRDLQQQEMRNPAPEGKKYVIRNGEIVLQNIRPKN